MLTPLNTKRLTELSKELPEWTIMDQQYLYRSFRFKNFYETMAFVNAIAYVAHQNNHHPDLELGYQYCHVRLTSHDVQGITEMDIACAKCFDALVAAK
ncbi:MAG: 4a-hydroxytetrahydrobiopterin dehydratase [Legionellaceae bacterium]|nr:4a-hydroxytetrahydrobiopterin dehydratase [Legionellaceae bacterium]